jgi:hypothetical protein
LFGYCDKSVSITEDAVFYTPKAMLKASGPALSSALRLPSQRTGQFGVFAAADTGRERYAALGLGGARTDKLCRHR